MHLFTFHSLHVYAISRHLHQLSMILALLLHIVSQARPSTEAQADGIVLRLYVFA